MNFIKRIKIENYRSCYRTTFEPNPHLSVLIGPNGTGKSNVLNAITLLKQFADDDFRFRYERKSNEMGKCKIKTWFDLNGKTATYSGKIQVHSDQNNNDVAFPSNESWNLKEFVDVNKIIKFPLALSPNFTKKWYLTKNNSRYLHLSKNYKIDQELLAKAFPYIDSIKNLCLGIKYYSASQFTNVANCPISFEIEKEGSKSRWIRASGHAKFLYDLYTNYKSNDASFQQYLSIVGPEGIGLVNKIGFKEVRTSSIDYSVRSGGKIGRLRHVKLIIIPQFKVGKYFLSPNQLSEGTFKTIALLFYLITEKSSTLLIEEPEVCIHHGLLSSILELIKQFSKEKQIIISTHSDFVLDHVSPDNVFKVTISANRGTEVISIRKSMSNRDYFALREYLNSVGNLGEYWKHGAL